MNRHALLHLTGSDDWRGTTTLALYRAIVAFGLVALFNLSSTGALPPNSPGAYRLACLCYLAATLAQAGLALVRWPSHSGHVFAQIVVDIAALAVISYYGSGMGGGLPMLLVPSLAAGGIMLAPRTAFLLVGLGALTLVGEESLRHSARAAGDTDLVPVAVLSLVYILATALAVRLTRQLAASDAAAANLADRSRDLAQINRLILDRMQIGAVVVDGDDRLRTWNHAARSLLAIAASEDQTGRPLAALNPALARAVAAWRRDGAEPATIQIGRQELLVSLQMLQPDVGARTAPTLVFIEDARRAGEQAQQLKLASLGQLTASIAHEIRNPLAAISHASQLLGESDTRSRDDERLVAIVHRHTRRIDRLIESVLGMARASARHAERLDLAAWLAETVADYRGTRDDPPTIEIDERLADAVVHFDEGQLRQCLFNLWDNSDRHARRETAPRIDVCIDAADDGTPLLDVTDDGPGIDAAVIDRIMEPFFTTAREGTGLGLHLAAEMCRANGARLLPLPSETGARFRILF